MGNIMDNYHSGNTFIFLGGLLYFLNVRYSSIHVFIYDFDLSSSTNMAGTTCNQKV